MSPFADKSPEKKSQSPANEPSHEPPKEEAGALFTDNRSESAQLKQWKDEASNSFRVEKSKSVQKMANRGMQLKLYAKLQPPTTAPIQKKENKTGLPDTLKSGIESLSNMPMDDVKVHYNSAKPKTLQAHAYAQGTEIHLGPGQEKHLPHEAWHVVQQKQGRVKPTLQLKQGVPVNDDKGLEKEADVMGAKALSGGHTVVQQANATSPTWHIRSTGNTSNQPVQRMPADWKKAPKNNYAKLNRGWLFDPWKGVRKRINQYSAIAPAKLDERRKKLDEIRIYMQKWKAHKKNKALGKGNKNMKIIAANMPFLAADIEAEYTEVAHDADLLVGGHTHTRHGADLTDVQLRARLTSGKDRLGDAAKAPTSSRFNTHALLVKTQNEAVNLLNTARIATMADFNPLINNYMLAWNHWFGLGAKPLGPAIGIAKGKIAAKWALLDAKRKAIGNTSADRLPVSSHKIPGGTKLANLPGALEDSVKIHNRYSIVKNHGKIIGHGFKGTGAKVVFMVKGKATYKWAKTKAIAKANLPDATISIFQPGVGPLLKAKPAAAWGQITHFPKPAGKVAKTRIKKA
jgi:hypothetical protein